MLIGRASERALLESKLAGARAGLGAALVISGEPGAGKTSLVTELAERATGFRVAVVQGLESADELPFAALQRLLSQFLDALPELPGPQRDALGTALGLSPGAPPSPFLVGLATLTLLSGAAQHEPLLCIIEDAHWLDHASAAVLTFVARRLLADHLVMLFCLRTDAESGGWFPGLPKLALRRLGEQDALALVSAAAPHVTGRVARRLIGASAGNPLALVEFTRALTSRQLDGTTPLPEPLPLGRSLQEHYRQELAQLPEAVQTLLLLAAADTADDPELVWRAAAGLGLQRADPRLDRAREYVSLDGGVEFRHPLVRSAAYRTVTPARRHQAHEALSQATDSALDPDRRVWHAAAARAEPDEAIARDLELAASRARDRGGLTAQAAFLARAAELAGDGRRRGTRFLAAAQAAVLGGGHARAQALLDRAAPDLSGPFDVAKAQRIRGATLSPLGQTAAAPAALAEAARALEPFDPALAGDTWFAAVDAAIIALGATRGASIAGVARGALAGPAPHDRLGALLLRGLATRMAHGHADAAPILRQALAHDAGLDQLPDGIARRSMFVGLAAMELWDIDRGGRLLDRLAARERARGALMGLRLSVLTLGSQAAWAGDFRAAAARFREGSEITRLTGGNPLWELDNIETQALRGQDEQVRASATAIMEMAHTYGIGSARVVCLVALVKLDLGRGRHEQAVMSALPLYQEDPPGFGSHILPDLAEAAAHGGHRELAEAALRRLTVRASASGTRWALGLVARSAALLGTGGEPDVRFAEAEHHLRAAGMRLDEARAHLLHGAWLRTRGRRADAVEHLRAAHGMLSSMGAEGYAERARQELKAAGARPARRPAAAATALSLTGQEEQVAALAARGFTNAEIAADLFISESTVAYHLRKVYRKLGVTSRRKLGSRLPA